MAMLNNQMVVYSNICHIIVMCWWPSELADSMGSGCWGSDGKVCLKAAAESIESIFLSHFELDTSLTHMVPKFHITEASQVHLWEIYVG